MPGLFLSYRRDDTAGDAKRIHDRLADQFGPDLVYLDVEDIPLGVDFVEHITRSLESASYVLIAIGPRWLLVTDETGRRRLDDRDDPVRFEIRTALQHRRPVVPMLIGGARMPRASDLPTEIAALVRRNGIALRPDPDFEADVDALMQGLHLDRIDGARVPKAFRVGVMARDLGAGGATGWVLLGMALGILTWEENGPGGLVAAVFAGALSGLLGGALTGWLTALLIRHKAPPLVSRDVTQMGVTWSLSLVLSISAAGAAGFFLGMDVWDEAVENAETLKEAIGAIVVGAILFAITVTAMLLVGLVAGSGIAAAYFARKLRLRSEEISRGRAISIGVVWLAGGVFSGVAFLMLLGRFAERAG